MQVDLKGRAILAQKNIEGAYPDQGIASIGAIGDERGNHTDNVIRKSDIKRRVTG